MVSRLRVWLYMRLMPTPLPIMLNGSRVKYRFGIGAHTSFVRSDTMSTSRLVCCCGSSCRLIPAMVFMTMSLVPAYSLLM